MSSEKNDAYSVEHDEQPHLQVPMEDGTSTSAYAADTYGCHCSCSALQLTV
ncbi:hypothetical protein FOPG_11498 [Fusarium oxysporum f. sp. conglutinans race 2 54008]|uniref:Uncharacterized protein n=2 Tax=Fusarium oxysporum TaxID=5507 RepID=X0IJ45_FUSOX|nr:hypothetical protein FOVG_15918 [Fusarium oxysporum f. sp. pisi HDV247]EXL73154.1 hypothetical protein FOPG_11498 [Fusarium oxysporum f. sp. conglutinans race 2 54008]